jgi:phage terminase large subunit-like protein
MPYKPTGRPPGRPKKKPPLADLPEAIPSPKLLKKYGPGNPPPKKAFRKFETQFAFHTENTLLPHLNGYKFYTWSREFFESTNRMNLLTAANQIGKSLTQIRKCIHWATCRELWSKLWDTRPRAFFYIYPDYNLLMVEFNSKWKPMLLPRGKQKDSIEFGWKEITDRGKLLGVAFNSGVIIWFKTYSQKLSALQGATLHAVFVDEELPPKFYPELSARLNDTKGYYHQVFTATSGHEMWRQSMMPGMGDKELFPQAHKQAVSLYDCMFFEDGTPGRYDTKRIEEIKLGAGQTLKLIGASMASLCRKRA